MSWSANNLACTTTWSTLFAMDESVRPFPASAAVKMRQLTFWNAAASPELREVAASELTLRIDKVFRVTRGATYEDNRTHDDAIADMRSVLLSADDTIERLAEINDANYRFWQEGS